MNEQKLNHAIEILKCQKLTPYEIRDGIDMIYETFGSERPQSHCISDYSNGFIDDEDNIIKYINPQAKDDIGRKEFMDFMRREALLDRAIWSGNESDTSVNSSLFLARNPKDYIYFIIYPTRIS